MSEAKEPEKTQDYYACWGQVLPAVKAVMEEARREADSLIEGATKKKDTYSNAWWYGHLAEKAIAAAPEEQRPRLRVATTFILSMEKISDALAAKLSQAESVDWGIESARRELEAARTSFLFSLTCLESVGGPAQEIEMMRAALAGESPRTGDYSVSCLLRGIIDPDWREHDAEKRRQERADERMKIPDVIAALRDAGILDPAHQRAVLLLWDGMLGSRSLNNGPDLLFAEIDGVRIPIAEYAKTFAASPEGQEYVTAADAAGEATE